MANLIKKAGQLAVESADMMLEAAKIAWRFGSPTVKAFMVISGAGVNSLACVWLIIEIVALGATPQKINVV